MPIETTWLDDEQTILCHQFSNPLSIQDFRTAFAQPDNTKTNYVIVDTFAVDDIPRGLLVHGKNMTAPLNTKERVAVVAATSAQVKILLQSLLGLAGYRIVEFVETMEVAEARIRQIQAEHES